jgi:hypothetical protein
MTSKRGKLCFDPYALLKALERQRVIYILIGAFARVIVGADEVTRGVDLTPSMREENLRRLDLALGEMNAHRLDGGEPNAQATDFEREPVLALETDYGELKLVPYPAGTRGYDDLRRACERQPIGQGLRPRVASMGDLARMLNGLGRPQDIPKLLDMRRLIELEHGLHRGMGIDF